VQRIAVPDQLERFLDAAQAGMGLVFHRPYPKAVELAALENQRPSLSTAAGFGTGFLPGRTSPAACLPASAARS
jgi:hypothetical protein